MRELFCFLQLWFNEKNIRSVDIILLILCLVLSIISVLVCPNLPALPFCVMQTIVSMAFFGFGWYVRRHPMHPWIVVAFVLAWPVAILYGGIGLDNCTMHWYPLSFIGACGGTIVAYCLCKWMNKGFKNLLLLNLIPRGLAWCGVFSLPILCMHDVELYSGFLNSLAIRWPFFHRLMGWGEIAVAILMTVVIIHIPLTKRIYAK